MINNKDTHPLEYYTQKYSLLDPQAAADRCGAAFDAQNGFFTLPFLSYPLRITWPNFGVSCPDDSCPRALLSASVSILALRYLIGGVSAPSSGAFLSYRQLPWGDVYNSNFKGRCIDRLARAFGADPAAFSRACEALGGTPVNMGDAAYELPVTEQVKLRLILYSGDAEFGPSSQFLFSDNIALAFSAEDVAVLGELVISALKEASKLPEKHRDMN